MKGKENYANDLSPDPTPTETTSLLRGSKEKQESSWVPSSFKELTIFEITLYCLAAITVCLWLLDLIFSGSSIVIMIGVLSSVFVMLKTLEQQKKIVNVELLQATEENLHEELLKSQVQKENLKTQLRDLEEVTKKVEQADKSLKMIQTTRQSSADDLFKQLEHNREIRENYRNSVTTGRQQVLTSILMESDSNNDMFFSDQEIKDLSSKVSSLTNNKIDETAVKKCIKAANGSMVALMKNMNNILEHVSEHVE